MIKKDSKVISVILIILLCVLIIPYIRVILYTLPAADDFTNATRISTEYSVLTAIKAATESWWTWGGAWTYTFLQKLLNPVSLFNNNMRMIGLEMLCFFLMFIFSLWYMIGIFCQRILNNGSINLRLVMLLFLFQFWVL